MTLFGINFAIGVATGIILEFEFGTNWSNYSWFVGDIFGAPLAIEGIMAFFLESTFVAVMFFGWNKVSKKFHLVSTWLVAIGANLSALWILVANAWMQNPVGMRFNPDTARNEMLDFWAVLLSPTAINKFFHTVTSGYVLAAIFVLGVSSWFLLKKREERFAKRSIIVASTFGLFMGMLMLFTGDESAREVARVQPMKFAAMEGLYDGQQNAPLVAIGFFERPQDPDDPHPREFAIKIEIPNMLSYMAFLNPRAFVPGIKDLIQGNDQRNIMSSYEKIERGKIARQVLFDYKQAIENENDEMASLLRAKFEDETWLNEYFRYFGYGFFEDPKDLIPNVPVSFYSFHVMVFLAVHFMVMFFLSLLFIYKGWMAKKKWFQWLAILTIPLVYLASMSGWMLAEFGRQPWVIQDLMPTMAAVSKINTSSVKITLALFIITFSVLLLAEIKIMFHQIKKGPKEGGQ